MKEADITKKRKRKKKNHHKYATLSYTQFALTGQSKCICKGSSVLHKHIQDRSHQHEVKVDIPTAQWKW